MQPGVSGGEAGIGARLLGLPFCGWHARVLATIGGASLSDAYDATAIASVLPVLVGAWRLTPVQTGMLISAGYVGQMAGALGAGVLAGRWGRIGTLRVSLWVLSVMSLACAFAPSYGVLLALRVVQGLGLGAEPPIAAAYLNEVAPARIRGRMISVLAVVFATGAMLAAVAGAVMIPHFGWRAMFVLGGLPLLLVLGLRRLVPESPVWLAASGRMGEAEAVMAGIERAVFAGGAMPARGVPAVAVAAGAVPADARGAGLPGGVGRAGMGALLGAGLRRATVSGWLIAVATSVMAYGIIAWMPTIYRTVYHLPVAVALRYGAVTGVLSIGGAVTSVLVVDRIGRRPTIAVGFALAGLCMAGLAGWGAVLTPVQVMAVVTVAYAALGLPLATQYVYLSELYPTWLRGLGVGVGTAWMRLASIVTPPLIGGILAAGSVRGVYLLFAGAAGMGLAAILVVGRETRPGLCPGPAGGKRPQTRIT